MLIPVQAATQHGCFTYPQANLVGWSYNLLQSAVDRDHLVAVRRGVWMQAGLWAALDERGQHVARLHADLLVMGKHWHAARGSVAVLQELPLIGKAPARSQLVADPEGTRRRAMDRHRQVAPLPEHDTTVVDGIPCTEVDRAVVDIARTEPFLNGVVVADALLARGIPKAALEEVLSRMQSWPGAEAAAEVIAFADGLSESALESLSRVRVHQRGLPAPELQVEIYLGNELLGRTDKLWRAFNVVGEDDGMEKFGSTSSERQESFKQMYRRSRRIEDAGLVIARWDWDEAWRNNGRVVDERLQRAMAEGRHKELDPRIRFVPTTVADRLRREQRWAS